MKYQAVIWATENDLQQVLTTDRPKVKRDEYGYLVFAGECKDDVDWALQPQIVHVLKGCTVCTAAEDTRQLEERTKASNINRF